jgi:hypothetical protein
VAFFLLRLARKRPRTTCDFFSVTAVPSQAVEGGLRLACLCLCHRHRHRHARSMGGLGYLPRGFVLLWGCRIGHTAQFVCSAEGLVSSLSLIADGGNQELGLGLGRFD